MGLLCDDYQSSSPVPLLAVFGIDSPLLLSLIARDKAREERGHVDRVLTLDPDPPCL